MEWISVNDRLPEIPEGRYGVQILIAEFDSIYEECNPGQGYRVSQASYHFISDAERKTWGWSEAVKADFMQLYSGPTGSEWGPCADVVTHWMPLPAPPTTKPE